MPVLLAAPLAPIFVAAALMLLVWAVTMLFQRPLVFLLQRVPVVGYSIAEAVGGAIGAVLNWALSWAVMAVDPLVQLVLIPIRAVGDFVAQVAATFGTVAGAIARVAQVAAGEIGQVADLVATLAGRVSLAISRIAAGALALAALAGDVARIISTTIPAAIGAVWARVTALVSAAIAAAERGLTATIDALRSWAVARLAQITAALAAAIATVRAWVLSVVVAAVRPLEAGLDALGRAIEQTIGSILARLVALERLLPLLALIPLVGVIPRTIEEFWRTKRGCTDPTCDFLGDVLQGLGAAGELLTGSVFLGLVAAAISDPAGTAQGIASESGTFHDVASEVTSVLAGRAL